MEFEFTGGFLRYYAGHCQTAWPCLLSAGLRPAGLASRFVVVTRAPHRELPLPVSPGLTTAQFVGQILAI